MKKHLFLFLIACLFIITASAQEIQSFKFTSSGTKFKLGNLTQNTENITITPAVKDAGGLQTNTIIKDIEYVITAKQEYTVSSNFSDLRLENNSLTSLDVSHLTNLERLSCYYNRLASLDVSNLTNLGILNCSYNQLTSLDVSNLTNLTYLDCSSNQILDIKNDNTPSNLTFIGSNQTVVILMKENELGGYISENSYTIAEGHNIAIPSTITFEGGYFKCIQFPSEDIAFSTILGWANKELEGKLKFSIKQPFKFISSKTKFKLGISSKNTENITITPVVKDAGGLQTNTIIKGAEYEITANQEYTVSSDFLNLGLQSNSLTSLDVSNLTNLESLDCSYNQLTSLDASNLTNLKMLFCSYNPLTSLDVSHLTNLERLSCYYNRLASLDVSHLTNLERLYCNYNRLTSLDVSNLTKLEMLNCSNNQMLDIINENTPSNVDLDGGKQTVVILMKENESGGYISENSYTFAEGHSLNVPTTITFEGGYFKCTELPSEYVTFSTSLGWDNQELEGKLKFSIKQPFKFISSGTKFKLGINSENTENITITPAVKDADGLQTNTIIKDTEYVITANQEYTVSSDFLDLRLESNSLTSLDVSNLTNLERLSCDFNQLTSLDASLLTNLKILFCHYNHLTSLDVSNLTNLERLSCYYNQLASLDVSNLTNLERLNCSYNQLTSLDVSNLTNLTTLDCSSNKILDIKNDNTPLNVNLIGGEQTVVILMKENESGGYISENSYTFAEGHSLNVPTTITFEAGYFKCTELPSKYVTFSTSLGWANQELEGKLKFSIKQPFKFISSWTKFKLGINSENRENITITPAVKDADGLQTNTIIKDTEYEIVANQEYTVSSDFLNLGLQSNSLTSLDVSHLTNLESLYCSYNQLTSLDASNLTNLKMLFCSYNPLTSLDVSNLTNLERLYCSYNHLTSLDVSHLTNLERLFCSSNQLTSLDVSNLTKLATLYCSNNQMLDIKNDNTLLNVDLRGDDQTVVIPMKANLAGGYISENSYTIAEGHSLDIPSTITFEGGYFKCTELPSEYVTFSTSLGWDKKLEGKLKFEGVVQQFTLGLIASPADGGTVSGAGTYGANAEITAKATVNSGFSFSGWFDGDSKVSEELEYKFKLTKNTNLIAKFEKKITPISVSFSGKKNLTGSKALQDQQFEFELYNGNTLVKSAKNKAEGKFTFTISDLTAGTYNYTLKEKNDNQTGYTYDTKVYAVSIIVSKNTTNALTHTVTIKDGETIVKTPVFTNSYIGTGINELNTDSQIKLYPNPVNDLLQIESLEIIKEITLSDISGKILITQLVNNTHFSLPTAQFKAGIYIVGLQTAKGMEYRKIIKE